MRAKTAIKANGVVGGVASLETNPVPNRVRSVHGLAEILNCYIAGVALRAVVRIFFGHASGLKFSSTNDLGQARREGGSK